MTDSFLSKAKSIAVPLLAKPPVVLGLCVGLTALLVITKPKPVPKPKAEKVWTVRVVQPQMDDHVPQIEAFGQIISGRTARLRAGVSGAVVWLSENMVEGGVVQQDELLLRLDPFDYEIALVEAESGLVSAKAQLKETRAQLKGQEQLVASANKQFRLRQTELKRRKDLLKKGAGSQKAADDAQLALNEAEKTLVQVKTSIATLKAQINRLQAQEDQAGARVRKALRDLEDTNLKAPFSGFLAGVDLAVGKEISANDEVAKLISAGDMEVRFQLAEHEYARLVAGLDGHKKNSANAVVGLPVKVMWDAGDERFMYDATVRRIAAEVDATSGGVDVFAVLDRSAMDLAIRPGVFVSVRLNGQVYTNSYRIPATAMHDAKVVYVVNDEDRTQALEATLLQHVKSDVLIHADFKENQPLVISSFAEMGPGLKVKVRMSDDSVSGGN